MNTDPEKNRAEYVQHLENQVQHLQRQLGEIQVDARWIPQVNTVMEPSTDLVRVTLSFGGKRVTASFTQHTLRTSSITDITTAALDSFMDNLVKGRLREVIEPEIQKAIQSSTAIGTAGKW